MSKQWIFALVQITYPRVAYVKFQPSDVWLEPTAAARS